MIKLLTGITLTALCTSALGQTLTTIEQTQALNQFQQFQKLLNAKDIIALNKQIKPIVYQRDHVAAGESGPSFCSDGDTTIKMDEAAVKKCDKNILKNLSELRQVKVIPTTQYFNKVVLVGKQDFCKRTFTGRFNTASKADQAKWGTAPGIIINIRSAYNPVNPESDEDGCAGMSDYFFEFKNNKLMLTSVQMFP